MRAYQHRLHQTIAVNLYVENNPNLIKDHPALKKQGSRSARLSPQSMTWDECKVYKNGVGAQYVQ